MIGRRIGGYVITEQIGMGGMATVYKAYDASTDRYVALKTLPPQYSEDATFVERFRREARAIARLEHLHILPLFAYGEDEGIAYLVMRYLPAGTLAERIRSKGKMSLEEASRLLGQIASALDHAHSNGVLHRDIKPSNVLVDNDGNAYLTDFGIARMVEGTLDLTGDSILGTPQYMSPEQCQGVKDLTSAADQYSLGVLLYEMVTGRTPYQAETPLAVLHMQIMGAPLPPPVTLRDDLPEAAERVILKALSREPGERYASCGDMAKAFDRAAHEPAPTRPSRPVTPDSTLVESRAKDDSPTERMPPITAQTAPPARGRTTTLVLGGVVIALVAVILLLLSSGGDQAATATPTPGVVVIASTFTPEATAEAALPTENSTLSPEPPPTETALPDMSAAELVDQADRFLENFEYDNAIDRYTRALDLEAENVDALIGRGYSYGGQGQFEQAIVDFSRAAELDPARPESLTEIGRIYEVLGDYASAVDFYGQAIDAGVEDASLYASRGRLRFWTGDTEGALQDVNHALELDRDFAFAYVDRASIYVSQGEIIAAMNDYNRALVLDPNEYYAMLGRVETYLNFLDTGGELPDFDLNDALADAEGVVERAPEDGYSYLLRGRVQARLGDHTEALADFLRADDYAPGNPYTSLERAVLFIQTREAEIRLPDYGLRQAVADIENTLLSLPDDANVYIVRGKLHSYDEDFDAALENFTRAIELDSDNAWAYEERGAEYHRRGDIDAAISDYRRALELVPETLWLYPEIGDILYDNGRGAEALQAYRDYEEIVGTDALPDYIRERLGETSNPTLTAEGQPVFIREYPFAGATVLRGVLNDTITLTGVTENGRFYRVEYLGQTGWVAVEGLPVPVEGDPSGLETIARPTATIGAQTVFVRAGPYPNAVIRQGIRNDTLPVTGVTEDGLAYRVEYLGRPGWIPANERVTLNGDITLVPTLERPALVVGSRAVFIHAEARLNSAIRQSVTDTVLPVTGISEDGAWYRVLYNRLQGWVPAEAGGIEEVRGDVSLAEVIR